MHVLGQTIQNRNKNKVGSLACLIDISKAYDSVN